MLNRRHIAGLVMGLSLSLAPTARAQDAGLPVVATFSILGDLVRVVGGDRVRLTTLVGPGGDAHVYSPTPADARALTEARVIFVNGLKFEGWIERLIRSANAKAPVVVATRGIQPLKAEGEKGHGHSHAGETDPHAWQSVANAKIYVANIKEALIAADAAGRAVYEGNAASLLAELDTLDSDIRQGVSTIPANRRKIITSHDAFQYFEKTYGLEFVSPQGVSTESEASARDVARIISQVRKEKIPAVFIENITDERLIKRIASESGARVGGALYSDSLSPPDGPAGTYIAMMRHNMKALTAALALTN